MTQKRGEEIRHVFSFCGYDAIFIPEDMSVKNDTNNTSSSPSLYVLPSDNKELQVFSQKNKMEMMEQVVGVIEFAVNNNLPFVEVFQFKNSDFIITLSEKDYSTNLDNIYSYYMKNESYEYCSRIVRLRQTLMEKSVKTTDENKTQ